jgi:dephospho-CoA kinase
LQGFVEGGESKLKKLNEITLPYVFEDFDNFCDEHKNKQYTLSESAILFESGFNKYFHKIIYVYAPEEIRIKRAFDRSGFSEKEYRNRMKNQYPSNSKRNWSNFSIENYDGKDVEEQVNGIHRKILSL